MTRQSLHRSLSTSTGHPLSSGILQRKCDTCGKSTIAGDTCHQCQQQKDSLQGPLQRRGMNELSGARQPKGSKQAVSTVSPQPQPLPITVLTAPTIQPKLKIGAPNDKYEQEADRVAARVMQMPESQVQRQIGVTDEEESIQAKMNGAEIQHITEEEEMMQIKASEGTIQRICSQCGDEEKLQRMEKEEETLQPKQESTGVSTVTPGIQTSINRLRQGGGAALPESTQTFMELRFGHDFSRVKVHTNPQAADLSRSVRARAFTVGSDIFFDQGEFQPNTPAGMRLVAHELTHTLQQTNQLSTNVIQRQLVSSEDLTANAVFAELDSFYTLNDFEERIRELSELERRRLRSLLSKRLAEDDDYLIEQLVEVLDNVQSGRVGATVSHLPESRPCEPGDVVPVSVYEWEGDPVITDLELLNGENTGGKLSGKSPSSSVSLFQRALIQWGCEDANPARNPLPTFGVDGSYGKEAKNATRQFQRAKGLSVDGAAGPVTIKAMARTLYGVNLKRDVEQEQAENYRLDVEETLADEEHHEVRINQFIQTIRKEGKRYQRNGSQQYQTNVALLVAKRISVYKPEIISEGLERILLQEPELYEHLLFGGKLIYSLQELGVYDVEFETPKETGFSDGFIIESNNLKHKSPLKNPQFSGWDYAEIYSGFVFGTGEGLWAALIDNLKTIKDVITGQLYEDLHKLVTETLPKMVNEPAFQFDIGRASAEMLHKQLTELNASDPQAYGEKLGKAFGMLIFEVVLGIVTAGAGLVLKGLKAGKVLAKFPRLVKLAKRIGTSGVVRAGIKVGGKITDIAGDVVQKARAIAKRARQLLPDLTSNAKATRKLDEFEAFDLSIADQKKISAKLDELDLNDQKLEFALEQAAERPDLVEKLAKDLEKTADDLEDLVNRNSPNAGKVPTRAKALKEIEQNQHLISASSMDGYTHEIPLPDGHFWRRTSDGKWCRFSSPPTCTIDSKLNEQFDELTNADALQAEILQDFADMQNSTEIPTKILTKQIRRLPGTAYGGENLRRVNGRLLPDGRVGNIPKQTADVLRAIRDFENFADFRETFWRLVSTDPNLNKGWISENLERMKDGKAPFAQSGQKAGGGSNSKLQLNHKLPIEKGGGLYDLDNIEIVTPVFHNQIGKVQ